MFVGLVGYAGSGKGEVAEYLRSKGWSHYSVKQTITEELESRGMEVNRENLIMMANSLRSEFGNDILVQRIIKKLPLEANVVIESLRNPDEIRALRAKGCVIIALDTPIQTRLMRLVERARPGDPMTIEALKRLDGQEAVDTSKSGIHIKQCIEMADIRIANDGSLLRLHEQIDDFLAAVSR